MKSARIVVFVLLGVLCGIASRVQADAPTAVTNEEFQAVTATGTSAWNSDHTINYPITITGILLNNYEDMLDSTWDPDAVEDGVMGAQWQIFIQGTGVGEDEDHAGTALWMGQNYDSLGQGVGTYDYTAWTSEMNRLNYDATTGHQFRQGDLVEVTVNASKFFGGKRNINEDHNTATSKDFSIRWISSVPNGLPAAKDITLSDLYLDPSNPEYNSDYPMFDQTRNSGAEKYQGMYVHLTGLTLTDASGWNETAWGLRLCTVTDDPNNPERTFTLRMPLCDLGDAPTGEFDVYGIINQESGRGDNGRFGYEIFVMEVVPEPATLLLLTAGGLLLRKRGRRG